MKIFISWSGDRSRVVAEALRGWIKQMLQVTSPWVSGKDIDCGSVWFSEFSDQLKTAFLWFKAACQRQVWTGVARFRNNAMRTPLLVALLLAGGFSGFAQTAVEVVPFRIEESRVVAFGDDKVGRTPAFLKLTLSLSGPDAESCIRYGKLKIEAAVDDRGASLMPAKDMFHDASKFKEYSNHFFRKSSFGGKNNHPTPPQVELEFAPPARAATRIARLRGSLELADAGAVQTIEMAGLTVTVDSGDKVRSIGLEITGDENVLESIEVVDATGRKVSNGMSSWSLNGGPVQKSLGLNLPLDDSMKLVAKVSLNRKIVKVPFDLKDVTLP